MTILFQNREIQNHRQTGRGEVQMRKMRNKREKQWQGTGQRSWRYSCFAHALSTLNVSIFHSFFYWPRLEKKKYARIWNADFTKINYQKRKDRLTQNQECTICLAEVGSKKTTIKTKTKTWFFVWINITFHPVFVLHVSLILLSSAWSLESAVAGTAALPFTRSFHRQHSVFADRVKVFQTAAHSVTVRCWWSRKKAPFVSPFIWSQRVTTRQSTRHQWKSDEAFYVMSAFWGIRKWSFFGFNVNLLTFTLFRF